MKYARFVFLFLCIFAISFSIAHAHEAYVLPYDSFWKGIRGPMSGHAFDALRDSHNLYVTFLIVGAVLAVLAINFVFRNSRLGRGVGTFIERFAHIGPHFVRISIALALLFSALSGSFLGPELRMSLFPYPHLVQIAVLAMSIMIGFGIFTELAALIGIIIFGASIGVFGVYVFTYLNYLGEFIVLFLFGMRVFSFDRYLLGPLRRFRTFEKYETFIIRVFYGIALIYAGVTVKLLHPSLTMNVVETWHLTQFHWLFPSSPLLITMGAGIVEAVIGLFIIFGFEMRLTVLVSLFYITLSLFYFRELVWPHLLLYGISLNLILQPEVFTLDHFFLKHHRLSKAWWKRPFSAHNKVGKSHHS